MKVILVGMPFPVSSVFDVMRSLSFLHEYLVKIFSEAVKNHCHYCSNGSRDNLSAGQRCERGQFNLLENCLIRGRDGEEANDHGKGIVEIAGRNDERAQGKGARGISQAWDSSFQLDACR